MITRGPFLFFILRRGVLLCFCWFDFDFVIVIALMIWFIRGFLQVPSSYLSVPAGDILVYHPFICSNSFEAAMPVHDGRQASG